MVVIKPGKSIWWTPRTKAHRKLGLFSKPFSCQSRCFHHGWPWLGDPGYYYAEKITSQCDGNCAVCCWWNLRYVILSWWNFYNHSDWLFLASKTFMKQWCKVRLQPCGFVWCSVWSYQWITWSAGLIGGGCSFQNIGDIWKACPRSRNCLAFRFSWLRNWTTEDKVSLPCSMDKCRKRGVERNDAWHWNCIEDQWQSPNGMDVLFQSHSIFFNLCTNHISLESMGFSYASICSLSHTWGLGCGEPPSRSGMRAQWKIWDLRWPK